MGSMLQREVKSLLGMVLAFNKKQQSSYKIITDTLRSQNLQETKHAKYYHAYEKMYGNSRIVGREEGIVSNFKDYERQIDELNDAALISIRDRLKQTLDKIVITKNEIVTVEDDIMDEDVLLAYFNRTSNTITATYKKIDETGSITTAPYLWSATNNVRNELNNERISPDEKTMPSSGKREWYFPREFPIGKWNVGKSQKKSGNPFFGDVFIPTNAHQLIETYGPGDAPMPKPDKEGKYQSTGLQDDTGYGLHYSSSRTTLGCIRFSSQEAANEYAALSDKALDSKHGVSILYVY